MSLSSEKSAGRPRILLLADRPGWAYDTAAKALVKYLSDDFEFKIEYVLEKPDLLNWTFDILYVFFWGENYHHQFEIDPKRVIKEVSSFRWTNEAQYGFLSPEKMASRYLSDTGIVTATSKRMVRMLSPYRNVLWVPNGVEPELFKNANRRQGPLRIGWAGNINDPCKGINDILLPAAADDFWIVIASNLPHTSMPNFYNDIDVYVVASTAEGEPLTLIEAMACGCYPVCVDVGIVPEIILHRENGLIVDRKVESFRAAFQWCDTNKEYIRQIGQRNAREIQAKRSWAAIINQWRDVLSKAYEGLGSTNMDKNNINSPQPEERPQVPGSSVVNKAKHNYATHLLAVNPEGTAESVYQASYFYYEAELLPLLPADKSNHIVDIGSGFGHLIRFLREHGYTEIGGVEIDPGLYDISKNYVGKHASFLVNENAFSFLAARIDEFNVITLFDVIEHFSLDDAYELLCRILASLKNDGIAVIRTPNMANILGTYSRYMDLTHQSGFTEQSLMQMVKEAGFSEAKLHIPIWNPKNPLTAKFKKSAEFQKKIYQLQDRSMPKSFDKNIVIWAKK